MTDFEWLGSSGEMAALIKTKDWAKTPLGPPDTWSPTLRMTVKFILANRFPVLLWWGPHYVQFYNDAYIPIPGEKHPKALGQCGSECWQEIWPVLQPLVDTPFQGGPSTWIEDLLLEIRRSNFTEETHFTIAYSPVPDDTAPSGIGGVLSTVHEITEQVVSARRVTILRDLSARMMAAKTAEQSCVAAAKILAENPRDIPFALIYLLDTDTKKARLEGVAGVEAGQDISPATIELSASPKNTSHWPLEEVWHTETMAVVEDIARVFNKVPHGPWPDPPNKAAILPIQSNKAHEIVGVLVAGISPRLALDDQYRSFLELVVAQIATSIVNARATEAIRINENKLRRAHIAAHSGAWEWHLDSGQVVWSPEVELLYGLPSGTFTGNIDAWRRMVHPEDLARIESYLPAVYKEASDLRMEFRITRMDGQVRWLEAIGQVIRDKQGNAQLVTGISTDITERKAVETELRLTTERFELALRDSSIVVFNQDLDLRFTWIYNSNLGYELWEVIGKRDTDLFERMEDAEVTESIKLDVIRTGISRRQEVVIRQLNVDRYYDLLVDPLRDSSGNITGVTCAAIDITERKQGEEALQRSEYRFRTLLDSNIIPIICGNNRFITEANDAFLQMVGYSREDLKAGEIDWVRMTPLEYRQKDLQALDQLKNSFFAAPYEKQYIRKNGTRVPILIGSVILSHSPEEYLCFIIDLSELKRVEAELRKYQHELEAKVAERTLELTLSLAAVGSEIRVRKETEEQLRELSGRLLRLQDEEHRRIARELHDSTGQTLSALKMSLSRLEQHVGEIPRGKALLEDLNMLADSAIQEVRTTSHLLHPPMLDEIGFSSAARWYLEGFAKRSGIHTSIDFGDLPELTKDEELALFRVLQESLTNVHRHSGSTRAEVRIYPEGESIILSIRDFGKGIPSENLENFKKTGAGVGVGLGGMKQRLHELGGTLEVRSEAKGITILAKLGQAKTGGKAHSMNKVLNPSINDI